MLYKAILLLAAIAYLEVMRQDFTSRRIPNLLSAAIVILAVARLIMAGSIADIFWSLIVAVAVFFVTVFLFARGWLGGGDVKLIAATVLLVGYRETYQFLTYMALAGGILSFGLLVGNWARRPRPDRAPTVPYGIAISVSAMLVLLLQYRQG